VPAPRAWGHDMRKVILTLLLLSAACGLTGCKNWLFDDKNQSTKSQKDDSIVPLIRVDETQGGNGLCVDASTREVIKTQIFKVAKQRVPQAATALDELAKASVVRVDMQAQAQNEIQSVEPTTQNLQNCTGRLTLLLPPAVAADFGGDINLSSDVVYKVRAASQNEAQGEAQTSLAPSPMLYHFKGSESISKALADAALHIPHNDTPQHDARDAPRSTPVPERSKRESQPKPNHPPEHKEKPKPAPAHASRARQEDTNATADSVGLTTRKTHGEQRAGGTTQAAKTTPAKKIDRAPSRCQHISGRVALFICEDAHLQSLDFSVARAYARAHSNAEPEDQAQLASTQRAFLQARDGCHDKACVAVLLQDRLERLARY
jgi:uncharacterized protein YecT (DUF1311 family)